MEPVSNKPEYLQAVPKPSFNNHADRMAFFDSRFSVNLDTGKITGGFNACTWVNGDGYLEIGIHGVINKKQWKITMKAHRFLLWKATGAIPEHVDHIDGDKLNNRISNLRPASTAQNARNCKLRIDNSSGYKGVSRAKSGRWEACIKVGKKKKTLGTFGDPRTAALAYDEAAREEYGEFAKTNSDLGLLEDVFLARTTPTPKEPTDGNASDE